jgi:hypothetical protein
MIDFRWVNYGGIYLDSTGISRGRQSVHAGQHWGHPRLRQRAGNHRKAYMAKDLKFDTGRRMSQGAKQKNIFVI